MGLPSGTRLGPYEIVSPLGAGGMGEVYRALDTRLDRTVAVKILPSHLAENSEARQRFDREARAISSLNHPNICTLFDVGHQDGIDYLVMEFLEGETLADRLRKGPVSSEVLLKIGNEICEGLEKAHKTGVVHRDLKPGNIMLTRTGVKLMDFGLAKTATPVPPPSSSLTATLDRPPGSHPLTAAGTIVGTFQYMSPEQVEGKEADARSDLFALGAVLYEMATGKRAFEGKTTASVIAAVLAAEPQPISAIQPMSPPALDRVVKTCLAKDPDERFQSVHDVKLQLKWVAEGGSQAGVSAPVAARRRNRERLWIIAAALFALLAIAGLAGAVFFSNQAGSLRRVVRAEIGPPDRYAFALVATVNHNVVSPDGRMIAFIAQGEGKRLLWVRRLSDPAATPLSGTDAAYYPFWSADSRFIGFFANGKMKKVEAAGGVVQTICDAPFGRGGTWNRDGVILFTPHIHDEIYRVPDGGGQPQAVTRIKTPGAFAGARWPYFLPDGQHFLFLATEGNEQKGKVTAGSLDSSETHVVLDENTNAEYASGQLFFVKDGNLVMQPFDPRALRLTGNPIPVVSGVDYYAAKSLGNFSVSQNGVLLYRTAYQPAVRFVWLDRSGKELGSMGEPRAYRLGRLSPNGRTVAVTVPDPVDKTNSDLWLMDVSRGTLSRFTFHPLAGYSAAWSPDGKQLAISAIAAKMQIMAANGSGDTKSVAETGNVSDWSPDGQTLLVNAQNPETGWDILTMPASGTRLSPFVHSPFDETSPRFSPDGHWVAYVSYESGRPEIYVVPFPGPGGRWQVSSGSSVGEASEGNVVWSRDGKQLYYRSPETTLMVVDVQLRPNEFHASAPRQLSAQTGAWIDTAPDGRILTRVPAEQGGASPITIVFNWNLQ